MGRLTLRARRNRPELLDDLSEAVSLLPPGQARLLEDHLGLPQCGAVAFVEKGEVHLVIYTSFAGAGRPYCHIQYATSWSAFATHSRFLRSVLAARTGTSLHVVDARLVRDTRHPLSVEIPFPNIRLFRSVGLQREEVDNLYSEFVLLPIRSAGSMDHIIARGFRAARQRLSRSTG